MKKVFRGLKRAFTLIELIITIVIVGILAGIAIAGYAAVTESAEDQAAKSTLQSVDREFRAMDAFNKMGDRGSVAIADMTEAAELGVTFTDEDGNGRLDTDETVTISTSEKTFTLTLEDATQAGEITSSEAVETAIASEFRTDGSGGGTLIMESGYTPNTPYTVKVNGVTANYFTATISGVPSVYFAYGFDGLTTSDVVTIVSDDGRQIDSNVFVPAVVTVQ